MFKFYTKKFDTDDIKDIDIWLNEMQSSVTGAVKICAYVVEHGFIIITISRWEIK